MEPLDTLLGPDDRWTNKATVTDPSQSIGQSADAQRLRLLADDLVALLDTQAPQLSAKDRERAALYGRTATGLLRYHYWMADPFPARWTRLSALRDAMMAANLRAVAEHGPALVFAHNLHLQRSRSAMRFGDQLLQCGARGRSPGRTWATGTPSWPRPSARPATTPTPDTVEGILSTLPWDHALIDARRLAEAVTNPARASPTISPISRWTRPSSTRSTASSSSRRLSGWIDRRMRVSLAWLTWMISGYGGGAPGPPGRPAAASR